ncbi:hypothetical protein ACWCXC_31655 [Streptomyces sp. NPDC001515]
MTPPIAPSSPMSAADVAAHLAASCVRTAPGDSDPDPDEALRRARGLATAGSVR